MKTDYKLTIRLTGMPFSVANRRNVEMNGVVVGFLVVRRGHNWGGNGTSYAFHPNETGESLGLEYFSSPTVKRSKDMLDSMWFTHKKNTEGSN